MIDTNQIKDNREDRLKLGLDYEPQITQNKKAIYDLNMRLDK